MADNILDQLKAFADAQESAKRTVDELVRERNLVKEISSLTKRMSLEFNETTKNIGKSVNELELGVELQEKLNNSLRDRSTIERTLFSQLAAQKSYQKQISELQRIQSLSTTDFTNEYNNRLNQLRNELFLGKLNTQSYDEKVRILDDMYLNTDKQLFIQKKLSKENSNGIVSSRTLLDSENRRLDKLKIQNGLMQIGKKALGEMGPLGSAISNSFSVTKMNPWVLAAQAGMAILEKGYENFKAFDKASVDVRKNLGALPGQANVLERNLKTVTIDMMHLGATFDDVAKSINEIANEFTGLVAQDRDLLKTTTALSKQFGIAEGTSVKFLKTLGGISGNSASSQRSMIGFAQKMAQASGVPLGKIMEDVANASDDVRVYVGSSAVSMIKAATAARMMGIDLNKAASSAEKLLQFESSISSELKASALLGQNVNFNYARQLAFNKDIIGANKEILKITKQVNFNQLNPIQQKAFADAAGKSVGELQDMLTQEKNIQLVKNGTNENAKKALADYERMMQLKDEEAKNEGKVAEQQILQRANQERLSQLQNQFNKLMSELAQPVMDIVEPLLDLSVAILPGLIAGIKILGVALAPVASLKFILGIPRFIKAFTGALKGGAGVFKAIGGVGKSIGRVLSTVTKFGGIFGKFLGPLGLIINAFTFIGSLMRRWQETPKGFLGGLEAIGGALYDTFLQPFKDAWDWISGLFVGKSPSELGLGIVKGIKSVGGMLLDVLTMPFRTGYNFISGLFGGSEMKAPSEVLSDITGDVKKTGTDVKSLNNDTLNNAIQSGNQQMVAKIDQLISMMANGGIAVNLDGQRINAALSTTMLKSGGFGQATTRA
jgi:hypothetical protein